MIKKLLNRFDFTMQTRLRASFCLLAVVALVNACNKPVDKPKEALTELPFNSISADSLKKHTQDAKGWSLVGNVFMNGNSAETEPGQDILLYSGNDVQSSFFTTDFTHGDLDLELDFMLSEEASLAIHFKGYYALNLIPGDTTTITKKVKQSFFTIYAGDVFKAPGLWQHLSVRFINPRFDSAGHVIDVARFENITLNGRNLGGGKPLQGLVPNPEKSATGPLQFFIAETRGLLALRNIRYKAYTGDQIQVSGIQYSVYKGIFKEYDTLKKLTPLRTGTTDSLTWKVGDKRAQVAFSGTLRVPKAGAYLFRLRAGGAAWLLINDREVVNNHGTRDFVRPFYDSIYLKAGDHRFQVIYANYDQSLVLDCEGPCIPFTRLTAPTAERHEEAIEPLEYVVSTEPGLQRGFFMHHGEVNTYTMAIGIPGGLNYAYDVNAYTLLSAWRGRFIDVSNMWTSRGESQRELPLGAVLELSGVPSVQSLADEKNIWQDTIAADKTPFTHRAYRIDSDGLPVFQYTFNGAAIEDSWRGAAKGDGLVRSVSVTNAAEVNNVYFILGNGSKVEKLPQGGYAIDDKAYYLTEPTGLDSKALRIVQARDGRYALMLPLAGPAGKRLSFQYTILW